MEFSAWIALVYLTSKVKSGKWKSLSGQEKFSCNTNFLTYFSEKLSLLVFLSNSFCNNDNIVSFVTANVSYNVFMLWRRDMVGRKLVMCMHGMHHPHSSKIEGVKNFKKNLVGRIRRFWFWKWVLLWWVSIFPEGSQRIFGQNEKKAKHHSIKNNYSNML